ncbi:FxDxF family PEP-CTERM protein [Massilia sp. METH4]|uniref:FxDxF family PEP-CTERM protein n=1 Tax=Massilia sp. METH4 TaxID=3123041 RepID=UPI0030CFACC7
MKYISLAAAALLLAAPAVHARDISSPVETLTLATGANSVGFNNAFAAVTRGDTFADRFAFVLNGVATLDFTATSSAARVNSGLDLTGFGLYNAVTGALVLGGTKDYVNLGGKYDQYSLAYSDLAAGEYFLHVSGKMLSGSGSFAGNGVITVSPVPEPATPFLLLGGLAVLAIGARRKTQ